MSEKEIYISEQEIYEEKFGKPAQYSRYGKMWDTNHFKDWKKKTKIKLMRLEYIRGLSKEERKKQNIPDDYEDY